MNNAEHAIVALAQAQHGAISRRQALREGLSPQAIDRRLATGEWVRVFQGAYRLAGVEPTWEQRAMAGCLAAGGGAVASHRAAAALFGMPGVPRWVEVTVPQARKVEVKGVIAHRSSLLIPAEVGTLKGIPLTTASKTIVDLAGVYSKEKLGPMLDYALSRRLVSRAALQARAKGRILRELLDERPASARPMGSEFEASFFSSRGPLLSERSTSQGGFAADPAPLRSAGLLVSPGEAGPPSPRSSVFASSPRRLDPPITYDLVVHHSAEVARQVRDARASRLVTRGLE